jgi:uncharacterized protein (DUF2062 family)
MANADFFNPVVVAPTFDNARTLARVLDGITRAGLPTIVINDGCADGSPAILQAWEKRGADRVVLTHLKNQGKAAALRSGFECALKMGFTHAVAIDTDGQLDPDQIPQLLRFGRSNSTTIVVGWRDADADGYPVASRWGRRVSNLLITMESGARLYDSQCGFRVYPLKLVKLLDCRAEGYGFEMEVLTRAAWAGLAIQQFKVSCVYHVPEGRVSHFRAWRDSLASAGLHLWLLAVSIVPWPQRRLGNAPGTGKIWLRLGRWISPRRAWRDLRCDPKEHSRFATALAAGVFVANLPLYGVQTLLSLYLAKRFRLNPLPVVAGSSISTPPLGALLIAAAIGIGHACLYGKWPLLTSFDPRPGGYFSLIKSVLLEWTIGGIICGIVLASGSYCVMRLVLRYLPLRTPADAEVDPAATVKARDLAIAESVVLER